MRNSIARNPFARILSVTFGTLALALGAPVLAQPEVDWWTVAGGGGISTGGSFEVRGTAGQANAGETSGGTFDLESGFWYQDHPAVPVELMRFEISAGSTERSHRIAAARTRAPLCRQDDEPADQPDRREAAPAVESRHGSVGPR